MSLIHYGWLNMQDEAKAATQICARIISHGQNHALNINLCLRFVISIALISVQRVKVGLFYKNNSASLIGLQALVVRKLWP